MNELTKHSDELMSGVIDEEVVRALLGSNVCTNNSIFADEYDVNLCNVRPLEATEFIEGRPSSWSVKKAQERFDSILTNGYTHQCIDCGALIREDEQ